MKNIKVLFTVLVVLFLGVSKSSAQQNEQIHNELRALLSGLETAVNTEKYVDLQHFFHKELRVTTVNQNTITTYKGIEDYFNEWFGEDGYLISLQMKLHPEALTELYANKTMGIVRGSGVEVYKLRDGRDLELKTRWTATVIKDTDNKWKILSLHLGTNFYDNAIYHEMSEQLKKWGIMGSLFTLFLGLIIGYFIRRRD